MENTRTLALTTAAALIVLVLLALFTTPAHAMRVGVVPNAWDYTPGQWGTQMAGLNPTVARIEHRWTAPLAELDAKVAASRNAGARPLIVLDDTTAPDPAAFAQVAAQVAARYPDNLGLEVWNEQNTARFWGHEPSAGEYATLLAASYQAVKAAAPTTRVILGGPAPTGTEREYVAAVLAAAPADAVAVHPYADTPAASVAQVEAMHTATALPLAVTEYGWGAGPYCLAAWCFDEATQARYIDEALDGYNALGYVTDATVYELADKPSTGSCLVFDCRAGLIRHDGTRRPSYDVVRDWTPASPSVIGTVSTVAPAPSPAPASASPSVIGDRVTLRIRDGRARGAANGCRRVWVRFSRPTGVRYARPYVIRGRYSVRIARLNLRPGHWNVRARCGNARSARRTWDA